MHFGGDRVGNDPRPSRKKEVSQASCQLSIADETSQRGNEDQEGKYRHQRRQRDMAGHRPPVIVIEMPERVSKHPPENLPTSWVPKGPRLTSPARDRGFPASIQLCIGHSTSRQAALGMSGARSGPASAPRPVQISTALRSSVAKKSAFADFTIFSAATGS